MQVWSFWRVLLTSIVLSLLCSACGGSVSTTPISTPTPTPTAGPIALSVSSITFSGTAAQTFSVSEPGYTGTYNAVSTNSNVATVAQTAFTADARRVEATSGSTATFTVTPVGGGSTTITITNLNGLSVSIPVSVTGGTFEPQSLR